MIDHEMLLITSPETTLKSSPVRNLLERRIAKHLRIILSRHGERASITRRHGRIVVTNITDISGSARLASKVFGVASVIRAIRTNVEMKMIIDQAVDFALQKIKPGSTFAVKARRIGTHPFTSKDLENAIGSRILDASVGQRVSVDLTEPDKSIYVDVKEDCTYIYTERTEGPGGLPYGCQGSVISLFSGSLKSRVSTWLMMKRGVRIIPLYCDGDDCETYRQNILRWLGRIYSTLPVRKPNLIIVPFKEVMKCLADTKRRDMMPILKMHAILIVANMLANEMDALGVVTGETLRMSVDSIGGVGLESSGVNVPIYRPIIGLEMDEVGQLARKASLSDESRGEEVSEGHSLSPEITSNTIQEIESSFRIHSILESALATRKMFPITPSDLSKQGLSSSDEYDSKLVQQRH